MCHSTINLGLLRTPGIATLPLCIWQGVYIAVVVHHGVGNELFAKHAAEFPARQTLRLLELAAQRGSQRTALHLPKFGNRNLRRVHFQGGAHRGEENRFRVGGAANEQHFVFQTVDGINDIVIGSEVEIVSGLFAVDFHQGLDFRLWINAQEAFAQCLNLHLPHCGGGGHELPIDIGDADAVGINNGEVAYARPHQALGTPATNAANTEDDDAGRRENDHDGRTDKETGAMEYAFFYIAHCLYK